MTEYPTAEIIAVVWFNSLNAELNPIFHLLALLGAHHILHVSRIRVNQDEVCHEIFLCLPWFSSVPLFVSVIMLFLFYALD